MNTPQLPAAAASTAASASQLPVASATPQGATDNFSEIMGRALAATTSDGSTDDSTPSDEDASSTAPQTNETSAEQCTAPALEMLAALIAPVILPPVTSASVQSETEATAAIGDALVPVQTEGSAQTETTPVSAEQTIDEGLGSVRLKSEQTKTVAIPTAALAAPGARAVNAQAKVPVTRMEMPISALADSLRPLKVTTPSVPATPPPTAQPSQTWTTSTEVAETAKADSDLQTPVPPTLEAHISPQSSAPTPTEKPTKVAEQELPIEAKATSASPAEVTPEKPVNPLEINLPVGRDVQPEVAGTSSAKYRSPMQKAEKLNDFTGSTEQKLPVTASATGVSIAVKPTKVVGPVSESSKDASVAIGSSFSATDNSVGLDRRVDQIFPSTAARAVERAQDMIALHAMRLRDMGRDSMQIVIKPNPDLHLALNLQTRDGAVEVTAQLQRGDYELLNRHWSDLQQQMEARGIRLAPLSNQNQSFSNNSGNASSQSRQHPEDQATKSGAFAEFALSSVLVPKRTATKTTAPRGWESWA